MIDQLLLPENFVVSWQRTHLISNNDSELRSLIKA